METLTLLMVNYKPVSSIYVYVHGTLTSTLHNCATVQNPAVSAELLAEIFQWREAGATEDDV